MKIYLKPSWMLFFDICLLWTFSRCFKVSVTFYCFPTLDPSVNEDGPFDLGPVDGTE